MKITNTENTNFHFLSASGDGEAFTDTMRSRHIAVSGPAVKSKFPKKLRITKRRKETSRLARHKRQTLAAYHLKRNIRIGNYL